MATVYSRPGGSRFQNIGTAPSYAGITAKYSSQIATALANKLANTIDELVLAWKNGTLAWEDFLTQYQKIMDEQPSGELKTKMGVNLLAYQEINRENMINQKRTTLTQQYLTDGSLSQEDRYNIEREVLALFTPGTEAYNKQLADVTKLYDAAIVEKIDNRRTDLINQYSPGGLTPEEQLTIMDELLKIPAKNTSIYNDLVAERARIETSISKAGSGQNVAEARAAIEQATLLDKEITDQYKAGAVTGIEADQASLGNWEKVQELMKDINVQVEGKTRQYFDQKVQLLTEQFNNRVNGVVFDAAVAGPNGTVIQKPVSILDIQSGLDTGAEGAPVSQVAEGKDAGKWVFTDVRTGTQSAPFKSSSEAVLAAQRAGAPNIIFASTPEGQAKFFYDKQNSAFIKLDEKNQQAGAYVSIPSTVQQEQLFRINTDNSAGALGKTPSKFNQFATSLSQNINKGPLGQVAAGVANFPFANVPLASEAPNFAGRVADAAKKAYNLLPTQVVASSVKSIFDTFSQPPEVTVPTMSRPTGTANLGLPGLMSSAGGFLNQAAQTIGTGINKATSFVRGLFSPKR